MTGPELDATLVREVERWLDADTHGDTVPRHATIVPTLVRPSGAAVVVPVDAIAVRPDSTLGQGGMGVVRLAEQAALGRAVAVKSLKPGRDDGGADLLREAWITGALEHPNIVPVHTIVADADGRPMIVMKRIEGTEWSELADDAATVAARFGAVDHLSWNVETLITVLHAVRFAHSRGIVHRDLKPANVMVGAFGEVYLLDWGIAVAVRDDVDPRVPRARDATELAGTPCYMAPEMLGVEHGEAITERTDIYLAGAILFELITGEPPHRGTTAAAVIASVIESDPALPADAPPALAAICRRAMARSSADRYPDVDALQHDLRQFVRARGAARLTERATARLGELERAAVLPGDDQRDRIYGLLGACRFGFLEALAAWPDDRAARAGLDRALEIAAEFELAADDPRAALALLAELATPPSALLARARTAADDRTRRLAALEEVGRDNDRGIGTRTRMTLAAILGTLFTSIATIITIWPRSLPLHTLPGGVAYSAGLLLVVLGLLVWARESMMRTLVNRRAAAITVFLFVAQTSLYAAAWRLGLPLVATEVLLLFLWAVIIAAIVIGIDSGLWPTLVGNVIAFAVATLWPEARFAAMAGANLGFTINAIVRWRPAARR